MKINSITDLYGHSKYVHDNGLIWEVGDITRPLGSTYIIKLLGPPGSNSKKHVPFTELQQNYELLGLQNTMFDWNKKKEVTENIDEMMI